MEYLLKHSSGILLFDFFGIIVAVSLLECVIPMRGATDLLKLRWLSNIGLAIVNFVLIRLLFPTLGIGVAMISNQRGWGLLSRLHLPLWAEFLIAFIVLDLTEYAQHYMLHRLSFLWRIHRAHHTDQDFDFSTGFRFHPIEASLTTFTNLLAIAVLGPRLIVALIYQFVNIAQSFLEHGNFRIPVRVERAMRFGFVTPVMHRIHHSSELQEAFSNYSSLFSWWDRLFNTYCNEPNVCTEEMNFGVAEFQDRKHQTLPWIMALPILREDDYRAPVLQEQTRNTQT